MAELGLLGDHQGMRNQRFDAVLLRKDGGNREVPPGGLGCPRGPRGGPLDGDSGSVARQRADMAGLPGGGRQQLAPPGFAHRPHPLALPPAARSTAAAPAPTQATTQVTAALRWPRRWARGGARGTVPRDAPPSRAGPPDPRPPHRTARRGGARHLLWEGGQGQRAQGEGHCPAVLYPLTADPNRHPQHSPPPPASQHRAATARGEGGPSEGLHEGPAPKG